jgi:hypothetical protein
MHKAGARCAGRSDVDAPHRSCFFSPITLLLLLFSSLCFKALLLKSFFKTLLLLYYLTSVSLDLYCSFLKVLALQLALSHVLFSLAFLKLMYKVLGAESCSRGHTQQPAAGASAGTSQAAQSQPIKSPPSKKPHDLLQQVFYIQW